MLEKAHHQASSLMGAALPNPPRLMALVSHGDDQAELPLLWRLCSCLVEMGYPVSVLDGTTVETGDNPGLSHVLDYAYWRASPSDAPAWTVIPSALGLQTLSALAGRTTAHLRELGSLFPQETVLLLYAKADTLATLLANTDIHPVLAVSTAKTSLMTSYLALKRLLLKGKIIPTTVTLQLPHAPGGDNPSTLTSAAVATSLEDCAKYFLDHDLHAQNITLTEASDEACPNVLALAMRMLECAMPLGHPHTYDLHHPTGPAGYTGHVGHTSQQHLARSY